MSYAKPSPENFPVKDAWKPLPLSHWNAETAAHLFRRMGYSANPARVKQALNGTVTKTIEGAFKPTSTLPKSAELAKYEREYFERSTQAARLKDSKERRLAQRDIRREGEHLFREYAVQWYRFARDEAHAPQEKFVTFLHDIFVVEQRKIREPFLLFNFEQTLREGIHLKYPELCKRVSREPSMIRYLDLNLSSAKKPNENFARELFELFILGEGNYTEDDIKEAARAFTGYRIKKRTEYTHIPRIHDKSEKSVFGKKGPWDGDDVIDLAFEQPAARTYLIQELMKFYLTDNELPHPDYIQALGDLWASNNYDLKFLIQTFFQSRLFFHPVYRGNLIKSPIQFYLGLCQDLRIDVTPFAGRTLHSMRTMGQNFYNPPNVRGWLYGQNWINATTISGRRQLVDYLFTPIDENNLNGNDQRTLKTALENNYANFQVSKDRLNTLLELEPEALADLLINYFITELSRENYRATLVMLLNKGNPKNYWNLRNTIIGLLQSPAYNLC
ncbi:MAG: Uncharacterised protein [Opitutia bacterium UBA7350]|nr:MAG: Uncharacterised protein [Opitutae bacterium UBA7350]